MASALGKRSRDWSERIGPSSITTRSKRRAVPTSTVDNDENENPFLTKPRQRACVPQDGDDAMDLVCDAQEISAFEEREVVQPEKRQALSPSKKQGQLNVKKEDELRITQTATPQTPRHRDALSKKIPITPRHRIGIMGKPLTPTTPRTPTTPLRSVQTVYNQARQLFARSSSPGGLVGREDERRELSGFVSTHLSNYSGGCVYVSGPPGTGKSALVKAILDGVQAYDSVAKTYINCVGVKNSKEMHSKLVEDLQIEGANRDANAMTLRAAFVPKDRSRRRYLVVLDEMDHLLSTDVELLYSLFEWSLQQDSRLVLVGIANALDLTDRFLPRLKTRNLKPQLVPFLPYTAPEVANILTTKLKLTANSDSLDAGYVPFIHPAAIQLCSKKVAGQTGDLRKAFDICRRAIDLIEGETKQKYDREATAAAQVPSPSRRPLTENSNLSSPASPESPSKRASPKAERIISVAQKTAEVRLQSLTTTTAPRVTIAHVARVSSSIFGNNSQQRLKTLNLQQKAALCTLIALEKRNRASANLVPRTPSKTGRAVSNAAPTIAVLYETYTSLCRSGPGRMGNILMLHPLTSTEFHDVVSSLDTLSLVQIVEGGASGRSGGPGVFGTPQKRKNEESRIGSAVGEQDVLAGIKGTAGEDILKGVLNGEVE